MNNLDIVEYELKALKLSGMASGWVTMKEAGKLNATSLQDGIQILIQSEKEHRVDSRTKRLIKNANFRYQSFLQEIIPDTSRGFDKELISRMSTCQYIREGLPVIITGPTGTGKSYLASALGHQACISGYKVLYYNVFRLLETFDLAQIEGTTIKFYDKLAAIDLLILDDCFTKKFDLKHISCMMQIMEERHGRKSTIFASQTPVANWYDYMSANTNYAEGILDRISHTPLRFNLQGPSLRKK